jgi:hypothetical protein
MSDLLTRVQDIIETLEDIALDIETGGPTDPDSTYDELERVRDEVSTTMEIVIGTWKSE